MRSGVASDEARLGQSSRAPAEVVVFDFDGTLVNRDSFIDFSVGYCLQRPARFILLAAVLPLALALRVRSLSALRSLAASLCASLAVLVISGCSGGKPRLGLR